MSASALEVALRDHVESAYPNEACGVLVLTADGVQVRRARNIAPQPHRAFEVPAAVLIQSAAQGERLVAIYHSHPDSPAQLSPEDRRHLVFDGAPAWPGVDQLVLSVYRGRQRTARRFTFRHGQFVERPMLPWEAP